MAVTIKFTGGPEIIAALNALPAEMITPTVERAMIKSLQPTVDAMKSRAPVRSGKYKASFRAGKKLSKRQAAQVRDPSNTDITVYAGAGKPTAHLLEHGTAERKRRNGARTGRGPKIPHIEQGWETTKDDVLSNMRMAMTDQLEKAAKKLAKAPK